MSVCKKCGRDLKSDEISLHRKIVDRGDSDFFCLTCMADYFECDESVLEKKITHFKNMGCTLFS